MYKVYESIVKAIREKRLREPFTVEDFRSSCTGFADHTYKSFLHIHAKGNPGENTELFVRVSPGRFKLLRPIKYNL